jgi:hypothetical protein
MEMKAPVGSSLDSSNMSDDIAANRTRNITVSRFAGHLKSVLKDETGNEFDLIMKTHTSEQMNTDYIQVFGTIVLIFVLLVSATFSSSGATLTDPHKDTIWGKKTHIGIDIYYCCITVTTIVAMLSAFYVCLWIVQLSQCPSEKTIDMFRLAGSALVNSPFLLVNIVMILFTISICLQASILSTPSVFYIAIAVSVVFWIVILLFTVKLVDIRMSIMSKMMMKKAEEECDEGGEQTNTVKLERAATAL